MASQTVYTQVKGTKIKLNKINDVASKQIYTQIDNYAYENELNRQTYIKNIDTLMDGTNSFNSTTAKSLLSEQFISFLNSVGTGLGFLEDVCGTVVLSGVSSAIDFGETLFDGGVLLGSAVVAYSAELFGNAEYAAEVKSKAAELVEMDVAGEFYDYAVIVNGIDEEIAYGNIHTATQVVTTMAIYSGISMLPGGAIITAAAGGLSAAGAAGERALQNGGTYDEAIINATVAGVSGAVTGAITKGLIGASSSTISVTQVAGYTLTGAVVGAAEPLINSATEYSTYGKEMLDENGNPIYDGFSDYFVENGGATNILIGAGSGAFSVGRSSYKSYREVKSYASNKRITKELLKISQRNYEKNPSDYNSRKDYFDVQDNVEKKYKYAEYDESTGMWTEKKPLDKDDPGLTSCLTDAKKARFNAEVDSHTINGKTKVNVGVTNAESFEKFVVKEGKLGIPGNYNFARLGDADPDGFIQQANKNSKTVVNQFETDTGMTNSKSNRLFQYEYEVDRKSISMHTGKEMGSNEQRLPGCRLPDGSTEVVVDAKAVSDVGGPSNINVKITDESGEILFNKPLQELIDLAETNIQEYNRIMGK